MIGRSRVRWQFLVLVLLLLIAGVATRFMMLPRDRFPKQAAVEAIRQRGGTEAFGPSGKCGLGVPLHEHLLPGFLGLRAWSLCETDRQAQPVKKQGLR